jgi:hypothetical protein
MKIKLPIKVYNEANNTDHWTKKAARHKKQKIAIYCMLKDVVTPEMLPCKIILTRISPRKLDQHDNLPMAFKFILDSVASLLVPGKAIGQADSDKRISVEYDQRKGEKYECAMEIEIIKANNVLEKENR